MTRWDPPGDLARLLDALAQEMLAADDDEVRCASDEGDHAVRAAAREVRRMVDDIMGDAVDAGDAGLRFAAFLREHRVWQH